MMGWRGLSSVGTGGLGVRHAFTIQRRRVRGSHTDRSIGGRSSSPREKRYQLLALICIYRIRLSDSELERKLCKNKSISLSCVYIPLLFKIKDTRAPYKFMNETRKNQVSRHLPANSQM